MRALLVAALATLAVAAPAVAAPLRPLVTAQSRVVTDGERTAALLLDERTALVLTDGRPERRVAAPGECAEPDLRAVGDGLLLWRCSPQRWGTGGAILDYRVQRLSTGRSAAVAGQSEIPGGAGAASATFFAVGARWVAGSWSGNRVADVIHIDWRTGQRVFANDVAWPMLTFSLSAPGLVQPLCRPLMRQPSGGFDGPLLAPFAYDPPWGVTTTRRNDGTLLVGRCGGRTIRRLTRDGFEFQLGAGPLSYEDGDRVRVERLATGERWSWRRPQLSALAHTARILYASVYVRSAGPTGRYRTLTAPIPRG